MKKNESIKIQNLNRVAIQIEDLRASSEEKLKTKMLVILDDAIPESEINYFELSRFVDSLWAQLEQSQGIVVKSLNSSEENEIIYRINSKVLRKVLKKNKKKWPPLLKSLLLSMALGTAASQMPVDKGTPIVDEDVKAIVGRVNAIVNLDDGEYRQSIETYTNQYRDMIKALNRSGDPDQQALGAFLDRGKQTDDMKLAAKLKTQLNNSGNQQIKAIYLERVKNGADLGVDEMMGSLVYSLWLNNKNILEEVSKNLESLDTLSRKEKERVSVIIWKQIKALQSAATLVEEAMERVPPLYSSVLDEDESSVFAELPLDFPSAELSQPIEELRRVIWASLEVDEATRDKLLRGLLGFIAGFLPLLVTKANELRGERRDRQEQATRAEENEEVEKWEASLPAKEKIEEAGDREEIDFSQFEKESDEIEIREDLTRFVDEEDDWTLSTEWASGEEDEYLDLDFTALDREPRDEVEVETGLPDDEALEWEEHGNDFYKNEDRGEGDQIASNSDEESKKTIS